MHKKLLAAVRSRRRFRYLLVFAMAAGCFGCASGDRTLDAVDPNAVASEPTYEQVYAIIHNNCTNCHSGSEEGSSDNFRLSTLAEGEVWPFTTCDEIVGQRADILARVEDNTMPPGVLPRLTSEQKLILKRWVENGAPAPCN